MGIEQTELEQDDEFAKAFAEAAVEATAKPEGEEKPEEKPADPPPAEEKPEGEEKPEEKPADPPPAEEKPATPPPAEEKPATPPPAEEKPADPTPAEPAPTIELKDYELSEDEKKILASFEAEWPEVAAAQKAVIAQVSHNLETKFARTLATIVEKLYTDIAPVVQKHVSSTTTEHFTRLRAEHSDYDEVVKALPAWIETQPKFLQPALKNAYSKGTTDEVLDLVKSYKEAVGRVTPQVGSTQTEGAAPQAKPNTAKAAALAPVGSKRTSVSTKGVDKDDFDAAWAEATSGA